MYAIYQALDIADRRQESGCQYTIVVDFTVAIKRIRSDGIMPGQRSAVAAIEVGTRLWARNNEVTVRWIPAHQGALGNGKADEYAKAANGDEPDNAVPGAYRRESSLSHMTRVATEARAWATAQWIAERTGDPRQKCRTPSGRGLRHRPFRRMPKSVAGRYHQLLSGHMHAAIGPYLRDKIHKAVDDKCWWCGEGRK